MAECKDIDRALANLARKIDAQNACCEANKKAIADLNGRINKLEKGEQVKQGQNKQQDLTNILKRLSKLEVLVDAIEKFVLAVAPLLRLLQKFSLFKLL